MSLVLIHFEHTPQLNISDIKDICDYVRPNLTYFLPKPFIISFHDLCMKYIDDHEGRDCHKAGINNKMIDN